MRWKKFAANVLQSNRGLLSKPYKLLLVVTKQCYSRCRNCRIWESKPEAELSLGEIEEIARANPFFQWLNITGGEPTEREDLPEIVAAFARHCPDLLFVNFATNGLRPDRTVELCARIQELGLSRFVVTVSIDGPPEVHDKLRGVPGNFLKSVETLKGLRRLGVECYAGMTLYPENFRLIDETVVALNAATADFRHRDLHVNLAHASGHYFGTDRVTPSSSPDLIGALREFRRARGLPFSPFEWVELAYLKKAERFLQTSRTPVRCSALMSSVYVSEHGVVYPCSIWDKPLGSLRDHGFSLSELLSNSQEVRESISQGDCPQCWTPCEAYPSLAANLW